MKNNLGVYILNNRIIENIWLIIEFILNLNLKECVEKEFITYNLKLKVLFSGYYGRNERGK